MYLLRQLREGARKPSSLSTEIPQLLLEALLKLCQPPIECTESSVGASQGCVSAIPERRHRFTATSIVSMKLAERLLTAPCMVPNRRSRRLNLPHHDQRCR
jgi:hypothetical protein